MWFGGGGRALLLASVGALLAAAAAIASGSAIPVKLATSELYDFMVEQAKFAGNNSADAIKRSILDKAKELDLPVTDENLSVERVSTRIRMKTRFSIPLEFPGYIYVWDFDFEIDRPVFIV